MNISKQETLQFRFSDNEYKKEKKRYAFVIDGFTLTHICRLGLENILNQIAIQCDSVLCCRMSPSQKALVCYFSLSMCVCVLYFKYVKYLKTH